MLEEVEVVWQWSESMGKKSYRPLSPTHRTTQFHTDMSNFYKTFISKAFYFKKINKHILKCLIFIQPAIRLDLTEIHFMRGWGTHKLKLMCAMTKMNDPVGIPTFGMPQAPNCELSPAKQVLPGDKTLWNSKCIGVFPVLSVIIMFLYLR